MSEVSTITDRARIVDALSSILEGINNNQYNTVDLGINHTDHTDGSMNETTLTLTITY